MDYISREEILAEYDRQHKGPAGGARKIMETWPAADVAPVRRGKWIPYNLKECLYLCSECNAPPRDRTKYCPNCGARMDGGKNV